MGNPVLQVIICSTRPGRVGGVVGGWFVERARDFGGLEVEVADLAEIDLPFMNEPNHPAMRRYTHEHTKRWSERIDRSDAVVLVTPEYNFGMNAQAKNALDYLYQEWGNKPVGFVSYGGMSGGIRAVQMLKQVVTTLHMFPCRANVAVQRVAEYVDKDRTSFTPPEPVEEAARGLLEELAKVTPVMRQLRE